MKSAIFAIPCLCIALASSSCESVSLADQGTLSKTAMSFDTTGARATEGTLTSQVERGRSLNNAGVSGGCSACH